MAFPFRSPSVGALVEAIDVAYTNAGIGTLLLKASADEWDPDRADNKQHRLQLVFKGLRAAEGPAADKAALELARLTMEKMASTVIGGESRLPQWEEMRDALAADGWEYDTGSARLTSIVPEVAVP